MKLAFALSTVLLFTGCATTTSIPNTSSINNPKKVITDLYLVGCKGESTCAYVGYLWTSKNPTVSPLIFRIEQLKSASNNYRAINNISFNIDGTTVKLIPNASTGNSFNDDNTYKMTSRIFDVPIDVLYKIKQSKNTRIKIITDSAVIDTDFKSSSAYPELINFINQTK